MPSAENQHCAYCVGTLSFSIARRGLKVRGQRSLTRVRIRVKKVSNAVGMTSILDRGQYVF